MGNTLATVLNDAGGAALVEKWLEKSFLERVNYDTLLANSEDAQKFKLPDKSGQYVQCTRKNRFRQPENVDLSSETSDPASGASMGTEIVKFPIEAIHEYISASTLAMWTSWIDLEEWAKEDLPMALMRRMHKLTQNAFKVGRYQPGKYAANGTVSTAFDTTAEATVTLYGISFTFGAAPACFVNGKTTFAGLAPTDRFSMKDFINLKVKMANAGTPKINGRYVACISEAIQADLMEDDKYFRAAVQAFGGKGLADGKLMDYAGLAWKIDDEPFTENFLAGGVRATTGKIHTANVYGKGAFGYLQLGSKSRVKPTFKVQDISKTGKETTIGYTVPFQVAIANPDFCGTITGPVSNWEANNA